MKQRVALASAFSFYAATARSQTAEMSFGNETGGDVLACAAYRRLWRAIGQRQMRKGEVTSSIRALTTEV